MPAISDTAVIKQIQDIVFRYGRDFYQQTELTHVTNMIIQNPSDETLQEVSNYLKGFTGLKFSCVQLHPTCTTDSMADNSTRYMLSEIKTILDTLNSESESEDDNQDNG